MKHKKGRVGIAVFCISRPSLSYRCPLSSFMCRVHRTKNTSWCLPKLPFNSKGARRHLLLEHNNLPQVYQEARLWRWQNTFHAIHQSTIKHTQGFTKRRGGDAFKEKYKNTKATISIITYMQERRGCWTSGLLERCRGWAIDSEWKNEECFFTQGIT